MFLRHRAIWLSERMDDPSCDRTKLFRTYRHFNITNWVLAGWRILYKREIFPVLQSQHGEGSLLDIGFGGGDVIRCLSRWASDDGFRLKIVGIEPDPRSLEYVQQMSWPEDIVFRQVSSSEWAASGELFDFVISNNVLHHLEPESLSALCRDAEHLCRGKILFNDLQRRFGSYVLYAALASLCFHRSFMVVDGLRSIRRSFTREELQVLVPDTWTVRKMFPFRLLAFRGSG